LPSVRINKELNQDTYFMTFSVRRLYYLFDRYNRWDILLDSLKYCQKHKGLKIYNWVFMLNHIHLIIQSEDVSGLVRDFKKYTSKKLKDNILKTEPDILKLFDNDGEFQFWEKGNMPKIIESDEFYVQKARYIELNPVKKSYVKRAEDWVYSSANEDELLKLEKAD